MPLLTPNQKINSILADDAVNIASHLSAAAQRANSMVNATLSLDDEALTSWLNSQPPQEIGALFQSHYELGVALNSAITLAGAVLAESGIDAPTTTVDVRSVPEKLADKRREFAFENGEFFVTTLPPEPEPELEEEPETD